MGCLRRLGDAMPVCPKCGASELVQSNDKQLLYSRGCECGPFKIITVKDFEELVGFKKRFQSLMAEIKAVVKDHGQLSNR